MNLLQVARRLKAKNEVLDALIRQAASVKSMTRIFITLHFHFIIELFEGKVMESFSLSDLCCQYDKLLAFHLYAVDQLSEKSMRRVDFSLTCFFSDFLCLRWRAWGCRFRNCWWTLVECQWSAVVS